MQAADVSRTLDSRTLNATNELDPNKSIPRKRLLSTQQPRHSTLLLNISALHYETVSATSSNNDLHSTVHNKPELVDQAIELADWTMDSSLWSADGDYNDTLVVQHFGPLKNLMTGCQHPGKGHNFQSMSMAHPTWCDKCGDFMWGFLTHAVKCEIKEKLRAIGIIFATFHNLQVRIFYRIMKVLEEQTENETQVVDEHFTGSVQIHMNFTRPINVVAGQCPPSFMDIVNGSEISEIFETRYGETEHNFMFAGEFFWRTATASSLRTITTFFLPRNTVKNVNISSHMTTREMIVTLLLDLFVTIKYNSCAYFVLTCWGIGKGTLSISVLYVIVLVLLNECISAGKLIRVPDDAYPLRVVCAWKEKGERRHLVLQENDTGDILWDMFEIPELENFLKILDDEERQYSFRIRQKYDAYRSDLYRFLAVRVDSLLPFGDILSQNFAKPTLLSTFRYYLTENLRSRGYFGSSDPLDSSFISLRIPVQSVFRVAHFHHGQQEVDDEVHRNNERLCSADEEQAHECGSLHVRHVLKDVKTTMAIMLILEKKLECENGLSEFLMLQLSR
uniref:Uncharacterized protein n=1 Tax=Parascaris equorum TaxID=6256 RepID=A0A914S0C8_PAREQ